MLTRNKDVHEAAPLVATPLESKLSVFYKSAHARTKLALGAKFSIPETLPLTTPTHGGILGDVEEQKF